MVGGTVFTLSAAIGLLRLPDLYTRMHAVTKAGTLGVGLLLVSAAVSFGTISVIARALVALLFVLLTAPVSAHMIGRAGYLGKVQLWEGTVFDDWGGSYDTLRREGEDDAASTPDPEPSAPAP
jgi:multicomponent Na+:H+ antiporter subunit G